MATVYLDGIEQSCRRLYALLLAFVPMFSRPVCAIYQCDPWAPCGTVDSRGRYRVTDSSRLIPYPDIGYAERQAEALSPRYGCQAALLLASIAAEDKVHGRTFHCYCCQF